MNVFVTGANRGIGFGLVQYYLRQGENVFATCRSPLSAKRLQGLLNKYPKKLVLEKLDVANEIAIKQIGALIKQKNIKFDIVFNNAGICLEESFGEWTLETFELSFQVNVIGPALVSQEIVPIIKNGGKLIQISSGRASLDFNQGPGDALDAYGVSKAALNLLTRRLASKLENRAIIVVALNPGWVQTDMGGTLATSTVDEAVGKMASTIKKLSLKDSGGFLESDGSIIPW